MSRKVNAAAVKFSAGRWQASSLHFIEAIRAAEARNVVLPDVYYGELQGAARQRAFSIAGITRYDQLKAVKDSLVQAQGSGQTFKQWQREQAVKDLNLPKYRLEAIFRTNLQSNYQAGRWEQIQRNQQNRPYLMYDAINDARTRPAHAAMDGIIRPVDDPFWLTHKPINGINCRCGVIALSEAQAQARSRNGNGLNKPIDEIAMRPDPGFDYPAQDRLTGIEQAIAKRQDQDGVLLSALNSQLNQDMKITNLIGFASVQQAMTTLAEQKPVWFPQGFNGIHAVSNPELFAGFNPKTALFYLSTADELVPGFKPAYEVQDALAKIQAGEQLTFNNEYALETVWHEMMHGMTQITAIRLELGKESLEEGLVQAISRLSYPELLTTLGYQARHQDHIITDGYAYSRTARNIVALVDAANLDRKTVTDLFLDHKTAWKEPFAEALSAGLAIKKERIGTLYGHAVAKPLADFKAKIAVLFRNAPRNSPE